MLDTNTSMNNNSARTDHLVVHLVDGTYELFRHFYGLRRFNKGQDRPYGAVVGVLQSLLQMIEKGATHIGVATDTSSSRSAIACGLATRPARASNLRC